MTDVSVLILFFNRPDRLERVFEQVRLAKPARLFLYQDGSRGPQDEERVEACRAIVSEDQIDWPCEVHRNYQTRNYGCDPSEYLAQKWAFSLTDKCIVLEDDAVVSQSFFGWCKALLDRFENDPKVWMLAGFNAEEVWESKYEIPESSAFFTNVFSIWGWASWRRVLDTWDENYSWLEDETKLAKVQRVIKEQGLRKDFMKMCWAHKASGIPHYETIFWASMILNDAVAVMSSKNQVNNIGVTDDSTHFHGSLATMPKRLRQQFTMARYEVADAQTCRRADSEGAEFYTIDEDFKRAVYLRNAWNNPWRKVQYSLEELYLNLIRGNFKVITKAVKNRVKKLAGN